MEIFSIKTFFVLIGFSFFAEAVGEMTRTAHSAAFKAEEGMDIDSGLSSLALAKVDPGVSFSPIKAALEEAAYFPQEPDWTLTLEQVAEFDFIKKGGSGVSYYYFQVLFNMVRHVVKEPAQQKSWGRFCYLKDCSTGLDPRKINEVAMRSIVRKLSAFSSIDLFSDESTGGSTESVVFLQGFPAPVGSNPWLEIDDETKPSPEHIREMLERLIKMGERGIKKIAVNLPPQIHNDLQPFVYLGEFIKEHEIELHIVGGCGHYCTLYLLPAAKTVYIEPYGYVYHKGNATGLLTGTLKVAENQREDFRNRLKEQELPQLTYKDRCEFIVTSIIDAPESSLELIGTFLVKAGPEKRDAFVDKYKAIEHEMLFLPIAYWPEEAVRAFIQSLSPELLEDVTLALLESYDGEAVARHNYINQLKRRSQWELEYYLNTNAIELISPAGHSYMDFLMTSSSFLRDSGYEQYFTVPKQDFNIPEKDKPYTWIFPSAELLRSFGIDVRGKNNTEMIDFSDFSFISGINPEEYSEGNFLYLSDAAVADCGFFDEDVALSNGKLERCFFGK